MNEQDYWNRFVSTGCVRDYLLYKGAADTDEVDCVEADNRWAGDLGSKNG